MRNVVVVNNVTLDGVMQSPAAKDEDPRGGFEHGGCAASYNDEVKGREMAKGMAREGAMLFGKRTYEHFYTVWHGRIDNPFSPVLDNGHKYVASTTLRQPLVWKNSTLLTGDVPSAVAELRRGEAGGDIVILGSGVLIRSLAARDLIDRYVLLIHPLILGTGERLFDHNGALARFALESSVPTTKGVIIATYQRTRT